MTAQTFWFICRASGIVAWLMLTASVLWGVFLSTDLFPKHRRPAWLQATHRWLAGLTVAFVAGHIGALLLDSQVHFRVADVLVPYASTWKPTAIAGGVIALWLLVAVELTALFMKQLPKNWWRGIHIAGYWVFWLTTIHAAFAGSDASKPMYAMTALAGVAVVVFSVSYRILSHSLPKRTRSARPTRPAHATVTVPGVGPSEAALHRASRA